MERVSEIMKELHHSIAIMLNDPGFHGLEHITRKGVYLQRGGDARTTYSTFHATEEEKIRARARLPLEAVSGMPQDSQETRAVGEEANEGYFLLDA